jgi:hypothetical protein
LESVRIAGKPMHQHVRYQMNRLFERILVWLGLLALVLVAGTVVVLIEEAM